MYYRVDVREEYKRAKSLYLRCSLLFSLVFTAVIIGVVLLVVFSKEQFLINFIFASLISVLFIWGAIYFFTNIYTEINAKYRYFKGYEAGLKSKEEVVFIKKEEELTYVNGLYVYPLLVRFISGITETEKIIYIYQDDVRFVEGDKLTITTYQRILIEAEKHQ